MNSNFISKVLNSGNDASMDIIDKEKTENNMSTKSEIKHKNKLIIFNSFEESNEADAKAKAKISPEQHLLDGTQRINEMYEDELKKPMDKTLKFRKND